MSDTKKKHKECAYRIARWMMTNQVCDMHNANHGRLLGLYTPREGEKSAQQSINWTSATSLKGLLLMYQDTADEKYYEAAEKIGEYLKTLQITGAFAGEHEGAFREITPQTPWCFPRDGLTASWALLRLYEMTGTKEYLSRVKMFNDWFFRVAYSSKWPRWKVNFKGKQDLPPSLHGSFHGGTAAYFWDYYRITGDDTHMDKGIQNTVTCLLDNFLQEDGSVCVIWDDEEKKYLDGEDADIYPLNWQKMHRYNDDFSSQGLLSAYLYYKEPYYLQQAEKFAHWLLSRQNDDGSFGKPFVASASATSVLLFYDLYRITAKELYYRAASQAADHLVFLQETEDSSPRVFGGLYGDSGRSEHPRKTINLRVTSYALIALLRFAGDINIPYYSALDE